MLNRTLTGDATWWLSVRIAAWHIWKNGRESMNTAILNVITEALAKIKTGRRTMTMDEVRSRATEYLDDMISKRADPAKKIKVVLFTEASTAFAASNVDVVLLGADRIACSGAVSNKTGSLQTALCAKALSLNGGRHKMQVIVVSETEKIAPPSDSSEHVVENNEAGLVSCDWHSNLHSERLRDAAAVLDQATTDETMTATLNIEVKIENVFFEWVGPDLIDAYITEKGTWTTEDIKQYSKDLGQKKKEVFADI
ncbi:hypothetical protein SEUCBS140593_005111 [Sporothrix eucalyptigena]|uniref:Uncharacterized protein n=1 Tax=Sporothrix eucalyptigena TaxID=1812306 RepID=A0ABP0BVB1_9PEZI